MVNGFFFLVVFFPVHLVQSNLNICETENSSVRDMFVCQSLHQVGQWNCKTMHPKDECSIRRQQDLLSRFLKTLLPKDCFISF